jgi:hypothetical protein
VLATSENSVLAKFAEFYQLSMAMDLEGAPMPNGQKYEEWKKSRREEERTAALSSRAPQTLTSQR